MRNLLRKKSFYLLLFVLLGGIWWYQHPTGDKNAQNTAAVRVSVAPARRQDVPVEVPLVGTVVAYETVAVKSRLDSQVVDVLFKDGDAVKEGQVLFKLDDRALRAQIQQLTADLEKEKAQLVNTQLQYERAQKLIQTHAVAPAALDNARAAYGAQEAAVAAAKANLDNARVELTYATILAPISGRTGTINVTRGNNIKANDATPLVTINQITPIRVQFSVPQRYYEPLKAAMAADGVAVEATHADSQTTVEGKLEYIDNMVDVSNGTFAARAVFANQEEKLWPGMFVNVNVKLGMEKNALTIPVVAVQGDEGAHFVFAVDASGEKAVKKPVQLSQILNDVAIVTDGLADGERVITDGILRLTDGAAIEIASPAPAGTP
jgi:multidrug efflux system membrane fusion protein